MKKVMLIIIALITISLAHAKPARLPKYFYLIGQEDKPDIINLEENKPVIFFIIVPAAAESAKKDFNASKELKKFTNNNSIKVPYSFFSANNPAKTTLPLFIYFDWIDSSPGLNHLNTPAEKLAAGLDALHSLENSQCIVITHGRGSLVFNAATHQIEHPIEVAIQLGATIPKDTTAHESLMPQLNKIKKFYLFYTQQPHKNRKPTLQPGYINEYPHYLLNDSYSILLLINNKHPQHKDLYSSLVGKSILSLCDKIKKQYKVHRNLFASLSNIKPEANMIIAIRKRTSKHSTAGALEIVQSNASKKKLCNIWRNCPGLILSTGAKIRSKYRSDQA